MTTTTTTEGSTMKTTPKNQSLTIYASTVFRRLVRELPGESDSARVQGAVARDQRVRELLADEDNVAILIAKLTEVYR